MIDQPDRFAWERALRDAVDVTRFRLLVLLALATHWDKKSGTATVGMTKLSAQTGVRERTVRDELTWAQNNGYLERRSRGHFRQTVGESTGKGEGVASSYALLVPQQVSERPEETPALPVTGWPEENDLNRSLSEAQPVTFETSSGQLSASAPSTGSVEVQTPSLPLPRLAPAVLRSKPTGIEPDAILPATDALWDAVMAACGIDTAKITDSARGAYNKAVADLRRANAAPEEVAHCALAHRYANTTWLLTPPALAKHFPQLKNAPTSRLDEFAAVVANLDAEENR